MGIELVLLINLALVFVKYTLFINANCHPLNSTNVINHSFYFDGALISTGSYKHVTLILFSLFISFLSMLEYATLGWGILQWLSINRSQSVGQSRRTYTCACICVVILVLLIFAFGGASILFAVQMESEKLRCETDNQYANNVALLFKVHCGLDGLEILLACAVRVWMVLVVFKIKNVWATCKQTVSLTDHYVCSILSIKGEQALADDAYLNEFLTEYPSRGKQATDLMKPFQPWFLQPWLLFLVLTCINPHTLLTPWTYNHSGQLSKVIAKARYYYFSHVLMRFILVIVQNACVMKMSQYHQEYHSTMRKSVIYKYGYFNANDANCVKHFKRSYILAASQKPMEINEDFDFMPTFFSFVPNINVDNPFYVLILVIGLSVKASDFLYQ